jgi:hypothetical protein
MKRGDETMLNARTIANKIAALTLITLSLFSTTALHAATPNNGTPWRVFAPQGSGFYVQMPGLPTKKVNGTIVQYSYVEQTQRGKSFYGIATQDYSSVPSDVEGLLRLQCNDFAKGFDGQVVKWASMAKSGYQGIAARVENKDSSAIVAAWLVGRRVYCIAFATHKTQVLPDEAKQFVDSLAFARY